jgi:hypothetical protein
LEELKISEIGRIQKFREREIKREMRDKRERQR